jgi:hypothetical protein
MAPVGSIAGQPSNHWHKACNAGPEPYVQSISETVLPAEDTWRVDSLL